MKLHFNKSGKCAKGINFNSVYFRVLCNVQRLIDFGFKLHAGKTEGKLKSKRNKAKCREKTQNQQHSDNFFTAGGTPAQVVKCTFLE